MTYYVHVTLWDFAEITATLISNCLRGFVTKVHLRRARCYMQDFIAACSDAHADFETSDANDAMHRVKLLLEEVLEEAGISGYSRDAIKEFIQQSQREWCQHNDHLAKVGQSAKAGEINGYPACQDCYDSHLIELAEDAEFERSYHPHNVN